MPQFEEAWGTGTFWEVCVLRACLKPFVAGLGLAHAQGYSGKSVGAINTDATACRLEVRWGMKTKGEGTGGLNVLLLLWTWKFLSRFSKFLPLVPLSLCLETLFRSALDCFALVLYHTISNSGITKPASLMLVFMLGRQAWYKSEVFFFAFLFFFPSCDSVSLIYHLSCCVCTWGQETSELCVSSAL